MTDTDLLREAMKLLAVFEDRGYDPANRTYCVSREAWLDLTRNFRERIAAETHRRLGVATPEPDREDGLRERIEAAMVAPGDPIANVRAIIEELERAVQATPEPGGSE